MRRSKWKMITTSTILRKRVRYLLCFFILALLVSGLTAFPLRAEIDFLARTIGDSTFMEDFWPAMAHWISSVHHGITETNRDYPFLFYGTDWLAFAHIVIAIAFIGPLRDPVKNIWIIESGMIACVFVIPTALICGHIRAIPFFWRMIDCSFGIIGIIPLWLTRHYIRQIIALEKGSN